MPETARLASRPLRSGRYPSEMQAHEETPNPIRELLKELLPDLNVEELTTATERYRRFLAITWEIYEQSKEECDDNKQSQH